MTFGSDVNLPELKQVETGKFAASKGKFRAILMIGITYYQIGGDQGELQGARELCQAYRKKGYTHVFDEHGTPTGVGGDLSNF